MKDDSQHADGRAVGLAEWARATASIADIPQSAALVPVSDDASFRRYFRFNEGGAGQKVLGNEAGVLLTKRRRFIAD